MHGFELLAGRVLEALNALAHFRCALRRFQAGDVQAKQFFAGITRQLAVGGIDVDQMPPRVQTEKAVLRGLQNAAQNVVAIA